MKHALRFLPLLLMFGVLPLRAQQLLQPPFVGAVTDTQATVQIRLTAPGSVVVQYGTSPELTVAMNTAPVTVGAETDFAGKILLNGLAPDTRYYYRIATGTDLPISEVRQFS